MAESSHPNAYAGEETLRELRAARRTASKTIPKPRPTNPKTARTSLRKLTHATIRLRTKTGDTPLHRAAKIGKIDEIPEAVLKLGLFWERNYYGETPIHTAARSKRLDMVPPRWLTKSLFLDKNNLGYTPLHLAAANGCLNQVPSEYLTVETLLDQITPPNAPKGVFTTGSGRTTRTETVLHIAASNGFADQIPKVFLTPEFLCIPATGSQSSFLHCLAYGKQLDLVPSRYANSEIWNLKDQAGQTARGIIEAFKSNQAYMARVRSEPATEKQKSKLRYFGCVIKNEITKGEASDALDKCVRDFPEVENAYYNRPATEEQLAYLRPILKAKGEEPDDYADEDRSLTYQQAKDLIWECQMEQREKEEREFD